MTLGSTEPARTAVRRHQGEAYLPSGRQYVIENADQHVVVTEQGAGLRSYHVRGQEFLDGFPRDGYATVATIGQLLAPFPNRVDRGRFGFGGIEHQLPVDEVSKDNAIHGLTRWMSWQVAHQDHHRLTMELILHAQPGYPYVLHIRQHYELDRGGLTVTHVVHNPGGDPAPYGTGMHPYLRVGTPAIDSNTLRIPARRYMPQSDRLIPEPPAVPVDGTPYDFREPRAIGDLVLDRGFTDLVRDSDGLARMWLEHPSGRPRVTLWVDGTQEWLWFATDGREGRTGLAAEPYTCCSDAFNNGLGLRVLEPGETFRSRWGLTVEP